MEKSIPLSVNAAQSSFIVYNYKFTILKRFLNGNSKKNGNSMVCCEYIIS